MKAPQSSEPVPEGYRLSSWTFEQGKEDDTPAPAPDVKAEDGAATQFAGIVASLAATMLVYWAR